MKISTERDFCMVLGTVLKILHVTDTGALPVRLGLLQLLFLQGSMTLFDPQVTAGFS